MRTFVACAIAALGLAGARLARVHARDAAGEAASAPFTPSPAAAPFISLGYREAAADLLFIRLRGYFGGVDDRAQLIAELAETIAALDPRFHRIYEYGSHAMTLAPGVNQDIYLRAIALLELGAEQFPRDYRMPLHAGQIYTQDLVTTDPAQRRAWDETATRLVESATRMPGAPADAAHWVAHMRTKLGEHERAVSGLRELILLTNDPKRRKTLIERLAKLEEESADELASELYEARRRFDDSWKRERPAIPANYYILLGPPLRAGFDRDALAIGGPLQGPAEPIERLEPVDDTAAPRGHEGLRAP